MSRFKMSFGSPAEAGLADSLAAAAGALLRGPVRVLTAVRKAAQ